MRAGGFSLVELMIASLLALLVAGALGQLFLRGAQGYREDESSARLRDELDFALARLGEDLEMAGFWGEVRDPQAIRLDGGAVPAAGGDCGPSTDGAPSGAANNWLFAERRAALAARGDASAAQAHQAFPCISAAEFHAGPTGQGSDIVAIKRVSGSPVPLGARLTGHVYLAVDGARGTLYRHPPASEPPATTTYEYQPAVWYLRRWSASASESPRVPALCRKVLVEVGGLRMQSDSAGCVTSGIEDLQLELGVDTDGDGLADYYADPGAAPAVALLAQVVAVRASLLARAPEGASRYVDQKSYRLGGRRLGPFRDAYRRHVLSTLAPLRNPAHLRAPPRLP